jgi:hypothetical protein
MMNQQAGLRAATAASVSVALQNAISQATEQSS